MGRLIVNTGLESFSLLDEVTHVTETSIKAEFTLKNKTTEHFANIEAIAQLCALHTRYRFNFEKHAFLLKVDEFREISESAEKGKTDIKAQLTSSGKSAFSYTAMGFFNNTEQFFGRLLIAVTEYDEVFNETLLKNHYRNLFACLTKNI